MSRDPSLAPLIQNLIQAGQRIWQQGMLAATDGNFSCRCPDGNILITRSNVCKGWLTPDDFSVISRDGVLLSGQKPSTEAVMHLRVYSVRPDVQAVIHAHPPIATAFACCGKDLSGPWLPEVLVRLGKIPLTPFGMPGSEDLAQAITHALQRTDAMLLENHGALACGRTIEDAVGKMETIEMAAKIVYHAQNIGTMHALPSCVVGRLLALHESLKCKDPA